MFFSTNRGRMQRTADEARQARHRSGRRPTAEWKPSIECLEQRTLPSLFAPTVNYTVGSSPVYVASGDFNGDNKLDLAVANFASNSVSILLGKGDGTFQAAVN